MSTDRDQVLSELMFQIVRVKSYEDPRQLEALGTKDFLLQMSKHLEHRRPSHVLVRVVPASNVRVEKSEADYCDSINVNTQPDSAIRRTVLTPIVNDFDFVFCKHFSSLILFHTISHELFYE